ncbi:hypothetical protein Q1695_012921 [Nippostrongylus brasiliensis]|nr:hypothetical protein Q1695_012921 [Nippostrongylus brasiliensis]
MRLHEYCVVLITGQIGSLSRIPGVTQFTTAHRQTGRSFTSVIQLFAEMIADDQIELWKAAKEAHREGKTMKEIIKKNEPLYRKSIEFNALAKNFSEDEMKVLRNLLLISDGVIDGSTPDDIASIGIGIVFERFGQGLCAKYPRLPKDLCLPKAPDGIIV